MHDPADGRELYTYYRVAEVDESPCRGAALQMQASLRADEPGLQARLLRRPATPQGLVTFMEVYAVPNGVSDRLQADIERAAAALTPWLQGERHTELFVPCA